ncbi:MAG TPA: hypothetical protein VMZ53_25960 [Kofleriaceae bacterium]|nr:hypothetical protein [Kofleriaceae bacterium]
MKLSIACVAALSLFGCADEVSTSGDTEVSVVGVKEAQNREARLSEVRLRIEDVRFSEKVGTWAESLIPDSMDKACVNCELVFVHQSDGRIDNTEIWTADGNFLCRVKQTSIALLQNTCSKFQQ